MDEICFIDLFSGIGGFRLGLEKASKRFKCVWSCDWNKHANRVYRLHFGEENHYAGDVREVDASLIPEHDLLCAGFPCQPFSVAGKRKGFQDTRGTLFFEICRIAEVKRPSLLLLENVRGVLSHDKGFTFQIILESLAELGYWVEWQVLNSKYFGVPQNRERVFIIGHLGEQGGREVFPIAKDSEVARGEYSPDGLSPSLRGFSFGWSKPKILVEQNMIKKVTKPHNPVLLPDMRIRRLTPVECERLQGFPDNWTKYGLDENGKVLEISDTQRYKLLGNAVTVNVIEFLGLRIIDRCF